MRALDEWGDDTIDAPVDYLKVRSSGRARPALPRGDKPRSAPRLRGRSAPLGVAMALADAAGGDDGENEPSLAARAAWVGAEVFGKVASAVRADDAPPAAAAAALVAPASREEARARLRADYERAYFVAGVMDEGLYAADCVFADDIAAFSGRERFVANLANLGALVSEF